MMRSHRSVLITLPLVIGGALLVATIAHTDLQSVERLARQAGPSLPLLLLPSAAWHLLRTVAWRQCFPVDAQVSFGRVFRVRLAAEAFSWVTIRGVAGEPLKVALLDRDIRPAAAAAVALERIAYVVTTAGILALSAGAAIVTLPLTNTWIRIFVLVGMTGAALVIGTLLLLLRAPRRRGPASPAARSAVARFMIELGEQVRRAAREDRRRLMNLLALESAAYLMMAVEVWSVFRFIHIPVTLNAAFAAETFTRIASMASAFIPANLGALEASNVAAASAVHAAGGAAALALTRRVRGLLWCAGGFLVYPRPRTRAPIASDDAIVILEDAESNVHISERLGGMPIGERLLRAAARAGCPRVLVWAPRQKPLWETILRRTALPLDVTVAADDSQWRRALAQVDPRITPIVIAPGIVPSPQRIASARAGRAHMDVIRRDVRELSAPDALAMRLKTGHVVVSIDSARRGADAGLLAVRTSTRDDLRAAERRLRQSIFKPTDGPLGRLNRRISIPISIALIRTMRLSAHAMTALVFAASVCAGWLFSRGDYVDGVAAALVSLAASILDGCDGELARLQYTDSPFGCWLDTIADYGYYLSIFTGLAIGVTRGTDWRGFWWIAASLLVGAVLTLSLLILLRGRITGGHPERLRTTANAHFENAGKAWTSWAARLSMCATRATMPYGLLVFAVLNLLPAFVVLATIGAHAYWISLALQLKSLLNGPRPLAGQSSEPAY